MPVSIRLTIAEDGVTIPLANLRKRFPGVLDQTAAAAALRIAAERAPVRSRADACGAHHVTRPAR